MILLVNRDLIDTLWELSKSMYHMEFTASIQKMLRLCDINVLAGVLQPSLRESGSSVESSYKNRNQQPLISMFTILSKQQKKKSLTKTEIIILDNKT